MRNVVIYTCVTGSFDRLLQPAEAPEGFSFVCFVENPERERDGLWELRPLPEGASGDARERSRYPKFLPHKCLPDCEYSVWMDANIGIVSADFYNPVQDAIERGERFAAVCHPLRDDVYEEAEACLSLCRAKLADMRRLCGYLLSTGWPHHSGMTENNIIFRRHNDPAVIAADEAWAELFHRFPYRDQLILGPCLRSAGLEAGLLLPEGSDSRNHPALCYKVHPRPSRKIVRLVNEAKGSADARKLHRYVDGWEGGSLAIVIPAYRSRFLRNTLESIAAQSCSAFSVYVGDDASPEDLKTLCDEFADRIDLHYTRFEENLGGRDLVGQWTRCVALCGEDWVWLFSDDDIMGPGCVEAFHAASKAGADLLRFNIDVIDSEDRVVESCEFPEHMSARKYVRGRLVKSLRSYAVEYIFRRSAFDREGGFVSFDLAWNSDDATWLRLAGDKGIRTIPGPRVGWRRSGTNITSVTDSTTAHRKTEASLKYLEHLRSRHMACPTERMMWFVTSLYHFGDSLKEEERREYMLRFALQEHLPIVSLQRLFYHIKERIRR